MYLILVLLAFYKATDYIELTVGAEDDESDSYGYYEYDREEKYDNEQELEPLDDRTKHMIYMEECREEAFENFCGKGSYYGTGKKLLSDSETSFVTRKDFLPMVDPYLPVARLVFPDCPESLMTEKNLRTVFSNGFSDFFFKLRTGSITTAEAMKFIINSGDEMFGIASECSLVGEVDEEKFNEKKKLRNIESIKYSCDLESFVDKTTGKAIYQVHDQANVLLTGPYLFYDMHTAVSFSRVQKKEVAESISPTCDLENSVMRQMDEVVIQIGFFEVMLRVDIIKDGNGEDLWQDFWVVDGNSVRHSWKNPCLKKDQELRNFYAEMEDLIKKAAMASIKYCLKYEPAGPFNIEDKIYRFSRQELTLGDEMPGNPNYGFAKLRHEIFSKAYPDSDYNNCLELQKFLANVEDLYNVFSGHRLIVSIEVNKMPMIGAKQ